MAGVGVTVGVTVGVAVTVTVAVGVAVAVRVARTDPPAGATYCGLCPGCIARREISSMSDPPGALVFGFVPPVPSTLTLAATERPQPASVMLWPLPWLAPLVATMFFCRERL